VLGHATATMTMDLYGHMIDGNLWQAAKLVGGITGASRGHLSRPIQAFERVASRAQVRKTSKELVFRDRAAYRNRTDDLRITRRMRAVHGHPAGHSSPVRRGSRSAHVRDHPGLLLANALARAAGDSSGRGSPPRLRRGHESFLQASSRTLPARLATSSGSNKSPPLTCDDCLARGLTCEVSSRWFSSFHAESRAHVPAMCPARSSTR
jgi:hypothetical protein